MNPSLAIPFVNPLSSPLFLPVMTVLGGVLGAGIALIGVAERHRLHELPNSTLFRRWLTWLLIGPVYALAIMSGPVALAGLVGVLVVQGGREYVRLVGLPRRYAGVLPATGLLLVGTAAVSRDLFQTLAPLLMLVATLPALLTQDVRGGTGRLALVVLGLAYLPWSLTHLILIGRDVMHGPGILLAVGLAVACSDVGAFVVGRLVGRRKLAPALSPNKTWGGVLGNVVGAYVGCALLQVALPPESRPLLLASLPLVVAVGAVWGDLLESLIKRDVGAKDSGTLLPGMGGLLDRIDSLLVVAPLTYAYLHVIL